jgi:hypothetical protein
MSQRLKPWYAVGCVLLAIASYGLAITKGLRARSSDPLANTLEACMWLIFGIAWTIRFWQRKTPPPGSEQ